MDAYSERFSEAAREWRPHHPVLGAVGTLVVRTAKSAYRTRVLGLAAESAFFALLSLPALLLGLIGTLGHLRSVLGADTVLEIRAWILDLAAKALTSSTVETLVTPLVDDFIRGAQGGVLSVSFLVSLWSGSRAMSVFIEAITIAYGLEDVRGFLHHRALAFVAYLGGLLFALVVLPIVVAGPELISALLPFTADYMYLTYWPVVGLLSLVCMVVLYALAVPVHTPLSRHLPGALLAMLILLLGSVGLRVYLGASFGEVTVYGSLAAPIIVLVWLYVMALAVLIGSALNAEIDAMWPTPATAAARAELAARRHARARRIFERHERALLSVTGDPDADTGDGDGAEDDGAAAEPRADTADPEEPAGPPPDRPAADREPSLAREGHAPAGALPPVDPEELLRSAAWDDDVTGIAEAAGRADGRGGDPGPPDPLPDTPTAEDGHPTRG